MVAGPYPTIDPQRHDSVTSQPRLGEERRQVCTLRLTDEAQRRTASEYIWKVFLVCGFVLLISAGYLISLDGSAAGGYASALLGVLSVLWGIGTRPRSRGR